MKLKNNRLYKFRLQFMLTQTKLSEITGLDQATISRLENKEYPNAKEKMLIDAIIDKVMDVIKDKYNEQTINP